MHPDALIQSLYRLLGMPRDRCDLLPEKHGELDLDAVTVEKWHFQAEPGSIIPCSLYRPRHLSDPIPRDQLSIAGPGQTGPPDASLSTWLKHIELYD